MNTPKNPVITPERHIYPPATISPAAQLNLSDGAQMPPPPWSEPADAEGWRERVAQSVAMWEPIVQAALDQATTRVQAQALAGVPCHVATPADAAAQGPVYLFLHGGAFVFGGGGFAKMHAAINADRLGMTCVSVDYRMPPDHPYPAAPDDCIAVYEALLETVPAERIVIGGSSAGGNLAAVLALMARDRGLPRPAGVVLLTPEVDLTEAGDSFRTNALLDTVLKGGLPECNALYANGAPLDHPYLSPLMADLADFPPALIQTGTRDLFLSNSALFHRKLRAAGRRADLHVWEAMPHGGFGGATPEDLEIHAEIAAFIASVT